MKLSNKFIELEKENNSEAKKKGRETTPQRPNDKTVETARIETPQGRMEGEIKDRLIFTQEGEEIPPHQCCPWTGVSMAADRFLDGLEQGKNKVEPKSREMPGSSMGRNVRCEPRAKKIRKTGGIKGCLLFRTSDTVETGEEQPQQREGNALSYRCSGVFFPQNSSSPNGKW